MDASDNVLRLATLEQGRDPQFPGMLRQYAALEARHSAVPDDVATASLYQYTAAILGRNLPAVQSELTAMMQKFPGRPEPVLSLAMVALKLGNIPEATRIMEENPVDPSTLAVRLKPMIIEIRVSLAEGTSPLVGAEGQSFPALSRGTGIGDPVVTTVGIRLWRALWSCGINPALRMRLSRSADFSPQERGRRKKSQELRDVGLQPRSCGDKSHPPKTIAQARPCLWICATDADFREG